MDYLVNLDVFRGPLDLLLYLVKRDEVDIRDIPIARVARQFQEYLDLLTLIDVERAGDFLVMAATLMEIKSRLLLPRPEESAEAEDDPRLELVRQLIQYKQFKEATLDLDLRAEEQARRLPRLPLPGPAASQTTTLRPVELWDLVSAFGRLMRETLANQPVEVVVDHTPLHVHINHVLERLRAEGRVPLTSLFTPPYSRSRLVGLFLAILELTRRFRVVAEQSESFGDIWVILLPGDDDSRATPEEAPAAVPVTNGEPR
jgi:segregation and condensation protein A